MKGIQEIVQWIQNSGIETMLNGFVAIATMILFSIFGSLFSYFILKIFYKKYTKEKIKTHVLYRPIKWIFSWIGVYVGILLLQLPTEWMVLVNKVFKIMFILLIAKGFANVVNPKSEFSLKMHAKLKINEDDTMANFIGKIMKIAIYVIAGFMVASELNYDLSGLIAGLGLGGVVIALAAQDVAKNLFGGFAILMDRPFLVGDFVETKDYSGTVEDITFRSTKIRTTENTVITIPNSTISNEPLTNWNRMDKRRYSFNLGFEMETSIDRIKEVTQKIKERLQKNPNLEKESIEVHITDIKEDCINLFISVYTNVTAYYDYLAVRETVNCSIMELLEQEKMPLAYPTSRLVVKE